MGIFSDVDEHAGEGVPSELKTKSCLVTEGSGACGTVAARCRWEGPTIGSAEEAGGSMSHGSCGNRAPGVPLRG